VLADESANAAIAALDVIIESEHGPDSSAFLVTWSEDVAEQARQRIPQYWEHMSEGQVAHSSAVLGGPRGGIVIAQDAASAYDFINDYAPEHCNTLMNIWRIFVMHPRFCSVSMPQVRLPTI